MQVQNEKIFKKNYIRWIIGCWKSISWDCFLFSQVFRKMGMSSRYNV